jgi:DUF4097 and DUF4098 domain-containing protein YvlB
MEPVRITSTSGKIEVTAEARGDVHVDRGQHHPMGGILEVQGASSGVVVRVPLGTDLVVGSHSGALALKGRLGDVRLTTRSGRVEIEECASLDVRAVSGRVNVGRVAGDARVKTASGRVVMDAVGGSLGVTTVSGRIDIGTASGAVRAHTVNGRVEVSLDGAADVRADTVSGSVRVALPEHVHPEVSLASVSGKVTCDLTKGTDCKVTGRSVSGKVRVVART